MSNTWVIGGNGLLGQALKSVAPHFQYLSRAQFEMGVDRKFPFKSGDTLIDMVPHPSPRLFPDLNAEEFHSRFTIPHCQFVQELQAIKLLKYIFISSGGTVYGNNTNRIPSIESDPLHPISLYGESKKIKEEHIVKSGLPYSILRPSNIFDCLNLSLKPNGLINTCIEKIKKNEPIIIFGNTAIVKDYISNTDVARAIIQCIDTSHSDIFNISSGIPISIKDVLLSFERRLGRQLDVKIHEGYTNDVQWMVLNPDKAKRILNFSIEMDVLNWIEKGTNLQF